MRPVRKRWIGLCGWLFVAPLGAPAAAGQLTFVGQAIAIVGDLSRGDETKFSQMLTVQTPGRVAFVYLASGGGDIAIAGEIGRRIRAARLTTVVDAARYPCIGACVAVFLAGARRLYMRAPAISEDVDARGFRGLGFVQGAAGDTAALVALFEEFGVPRAKRLIETAPANAVYRLSGADALANGLATALKSE